MGKKPGVLGTRGRRLRDRAPSVVHSAPMPYLIGVHASLAEVSGSGPGRHGRAECVPFPARDPRALNGHPLRLPNAESAGESPGGRRDFERRLQYLGDTLRRCAGAAPRRGQCHPLPSLLPHPVGEAQHLPAQRCPLVPQVSLLRLRLRKVALAPGEGVSRLFLKAQALLFGGYRDALVCSPVSSRNEKGAAPCLQDNNTQFLWSAYFELPFAC